MLQLREGDRIQVDARLLFLSKPVLIEAVFVRWELHPMWNGSKPWGVSAPAIVRIEGPASRAPLLVPLGDSSYRVLSTHVYGSGGDTEK